MKAVFVRCGLLHGTMRTKSSGRGSATGVDITFCILHHDSDITLCHPAQTSKMALSVCTLRLLCVAAGSMVVGLAAAEKDAPLMVNVCTAC